MSNIVEMCFNPYSCSSQILINGKSPSDYSSLIQYMNEPLYLWCEQLFDLLYNEINDRYFMIFMGRKFDAEILKLLSEKNENCISFSHRNFLTDSPLQKRMILLNEVIKKGNINVNRIKIDVGFILSDEKFFNYINELEIKNRFCYVEKRIISINEYSRLSNTLKYLFIFCEDFKLLDRIDVKARCGFALKIGKRTNLVSYKHNLCCIEMKEDEIFDTIFKCFFFAPLCEAFVNCISSLNGNIVFTDEFRTLTAIKPLVKVDFPDEVELNRSVPLKIYTEPQTAEPPDISFEYDKSGIVSCNNQRIEGLKEGIVNILLYETGMKQAFSYKQVKVIKRNRIKSLLLSDKKIIIGESDNQYVSVSYFPEDADNAKAIEWLSTDTSIATVTNDGTVHAVASGKCQIICSAENISTRAEIEVKPYVTNLIIDGLNVNEINEITLDRDIEFSVTVIPSNAIDSSFKVSSSNTMIINTFKNTLHPVSLGEAEVLIANSSNRVKKHIKIKVVKNIYGKSSKKKSFWDRFKK